MVIGKGLIAEKFFRFKDNDEFIVFASGVSNSLEEDESQFTREKLMLVDCLKNVGEATIVYFSTCSIYEPSDSCRRYTKHKLEMEQLIAGSVQYYMIFRLPQVVGAGGNKNTLLNYLVSSIVRKKSFDVWMNATRNFIDVDDVFKITNVILNKAESKKLARIINVASPYSYKLIETVNIVEDVVGVKGNYSVVDKGYSYDVPIIDMLELYGDVSEIFTVNYLHCLVEKYYKKIS